MPGAEGTSQSLAAATGPWLGGDYGLIATAPMLTVEEVVNVSLMIVPGLAPLFEVTRTLALCRVGSNGRFVAMPREV